MKLNFIIIPLLAFLTARIGGTFTSAGMDWYRTIITPEWTPAGTAIGAVWTVIYILTAFSAIIVWNKFPHNIGLYGIMALFVVNAIVNAGWSWLFFGIHRLDLAFYGALAIEATVLGLMFFIWHLSRRATLLLLPYAAWVAFASYLTYIVWRLNG